MFQNKFFSRRLRQKSEEKTISRRISRFFLSSNSNSKSHVGFPDKLEIPTTPTSGEWYYPYPQHVCAHDDMVFIGKECGLVESDLSTCGGSNTTIDGDLLMYDDEPMREGQEDAVEHQHKHCMQFADLVRIVLGNAFEEADEQLEKEHLL